ncbi:MAG: 30S ribosomal protein S18 [Kiritimatiellae bacterium]|jgi:small subunit ribosomal protein S18|nr:30S ribosomal protein S18 [Kiritimatiellia bacterium]
MPIRKDSKNRRPETPIRKKTPDGDVQVIDINDVEFLRRFVSEQGKILPQRLTGLTSAQQRKVKQGVRRARSMGLMM